MSGLKKKAGRVTDVELRDTAHHEAGHAVAAHFHRVATRKVTIRSEAGNLGHHHHGVVVRRDIEWDISDRNRLRAEWLALVCLAGPYATRRFLAISNRPRAYRHEQHASDYHDAINVLSYFANGAVLEKYLHYMEARTEAFVEGHWWAITAVAQALLQHTTLKGEALKQVIAEASIAQIHPPQPRCEARELPESRTGWPQPPPLYLRGLPGCRSGALNQRPWVMSWSCPQDAVGRLTANQRSRYTSIGGTAT